MNSIGCGSTHVRGPIKRILQAADYVARLNLEPQSAHTSIHTIESPHFTNQATKGMSTAVSYVLQMLRIWRKEISA